MSEGAAPMPLFATARHLAHRHRGRLAELWRYYKIGLINTAFGYGLFAALVALRMNLFAAQIVSHVAGAAFNYVMFSRHVFHGHRASLPRYVLSYGVNYLISLAVLAGAHRIIPSPYIAGLCTLVLVSILNYVLLKRFVFTDRKS